MDQVQNQDHDLLIIFQDHYLLIIFIVLFVLIVVGLYMSGFFKNMFGSDEQKTYHYTNFKIHVTVATEDAKKLSLSDLSNENIRNIFLYSRGYVADSMLNVAKYKLAESNSPRMIIEIIGTGDSSLLTMNDTNLFRDALSDDKIFKCSQIKSYYLYDSGNQKFYD